MCKKLPAVVTVADSMNAQDVANTMWALATMDLELGGAHEPLMQAVVRVGDRMNA